MDSSARPGAADGGPERADRRADGARSAGGIVGAMARYSLPGDNVFPEGITEGGGTTFYVGSMGDGTIFRGDAATPGPVRAG